MYLGELSPLEVPFSNLAADTAEEDWSMKPIASIEAIELAAAAKAAWGKRSAGTTAEVVVLPPQWIGEIGKGEIMLLLLLLLVACIGANTDCSMSKEGPTLPGGWGPTKLPRPPQPAEVMWWDARPPESSRLL